jgi:hypothetical protein
VLTALAPIRLPRAGGVMFVLSLVVI